MNLVQDEIIYPEQLYSEYQCSEDLIPDISESEYQNPLEVLLKPGTGGGKVTKMETCMDRRRYMELCMLQSQTFIASVSTMSLDLARRLKLKLRTHRQIKVSGLGGVTTYINTHARVKITLGWSVVYVLNIWVGNIGEGIDVLCPTLCLVKLSDEETVVTYDDYPKSRRMDLPVCPEESIHLRPGHDAIVRIRYGQSNPQRELVWAGRGKNWETKFLYSARSCATAVKVVTVSDQKKMFGLILELLLPASWSTDSSRGNMDLFVMGRRDMKSNNNYFMSVPFHGKGASLHPDLAY
ncbi:LOW QUALITY PROTEIN: hypothetical protein PHMEG_00014739 [Phytophthora megakarya]|uniref:Uncharacterized protein n=1 Tax=Phytophthora megakarya TaxID=4795 RepID=A0A225W317_9STRA|nr:LOW QUALITY PROTEIN: hypothetical protein PHMEG_00014739 [Phytophthora megakarya]